VCRLLGLLLLRFLRTRWASLLGLGWSGGCLLLAAALSLGWALDFRLWLVVLLLLGRRVVVVGALLLELELMRLLDNGLAALRELDGWVGLVAGLLELVSLVARRGYVVGFDFLDGGFRVSATPGPAGCIYMSVRV